MPKMQREARLAGRTCVSKHKGCNTVRTGWHKSQLPIKVRYVKFNDPRVNG